MNAQPNILFFFPDQHRFDWLGNNPILPLKTPHLDALMRRGTTCTRCYTPSPICSPARACLATGRDYHRCGVPDNGHNTSTDLPNYYRHLQQAGYAVGGVGKFDLHKADRDWGLDGSAELAAYGFTHGIDNEGKGDAISSYVSHGRQPRGPYMNYLSKAGLAEAHVAMYDKARQANPQANPLNFSSITDLPSEAYCDNWIADNGLDVLRQFSTDQPWHLVVNFTGPHDPYDVTPAMHQAWKDVPFPAAHRNTSDDPASILERRQHYAAMIENIDRHFGRYVAFLEERGELENTVIIYCSDHGEMLGDHDRWQKQVWHEASSHVPLVVAGPDIAAGVSTDALIAVHDLAATFLDFAAAEALPNADAQSLRPLLTQAQSKHRNHVTSGFIHEHWRMVVQDNFKYVDGWQDQQWLFDLARDPNEDHNLANEMPERCSAMHARLEPHVSNN